MTPIARDYVHVKGTLLVGQHPQSTGFFVVRFIRRSAYLVRGYWLATTVHAFDLIKLSLIQFVIFY